MQTLSDGSQFKGLAVMDTASGNLSTPPLSLTTFYAPNGTGLQGAAIADIIVSDGELTIAGLFDTVNTRPFRNFALFPLTGVNRLQLCPGGSSTLISGITGTSYQWQMNTGTGFLNINDNFNLIGTQNASLQLINVPSAWYGYLFRCQANGASSESFELTFKNTWTGTTSNAWENPANWSCNNVPDSNTDVVINSGSIVINANTTIRSLYAAPGVNITLGAGSVLTVLH